MSESPGSWSRVSESPRFRQYGDDLKARLKQLSLTFYRCHLAFMCSVDANPKGPAENSPAAADRRHLEQHDPPYPPMATGLLLFQSYAYMSAAAEHMRGLGALYEKEEVMFPPPALIRCVLEHSARVAWLLAEDQQPEDRAARAFLEQLFSAVERKKTSGRLGGKDSAAYLEDVKALANLRKEAEDAFDQKVVDEQGQHCIRGQRLPGLEECVASLVKRMAKGMDVPDHRGIYDYVSNTSHPTAYPHLEMWDLIEVEGETTFASTMTAADHDKRASLAIFAFYRGLGYLIGYHGWSTQPHEELGQDIALVLPGSDSR